VRSAKDRETAREGRRARERVRVEVIEVVKMYV
jgi:hypothetical protein